MIYLASPYSHPDAEVREERYRRACEYAAILMYHGQQVLSPIAHSHGIAAFLPAEAVGFDFWRKFDLQLMAMCDRVVVLQLAGWKESVGVAAEIAHAELIGLPVEFVPV